MYLSIVSEGKNLVPKNIELIGATRKDSSDTSMIGYKGLGLKQAIASAVHLGLVPHITSADPGFYDLSFSTEKVEIEPGYSEDVIVFNYRRWVNNQVVSSRYVSQLTLRAFKDFDAPIGADKNPVVAALREFICNARDANPDFVIRRNVEKLMPISNGAIVSVLQTDDVLEVIDNADRYFKFRVGSSDPVPFFALDGIGAIYPKSQPAMTRLFVSGVLADCINPSLSSGLDFTTLYDYSVALKTLVSEDRRLSNIYSYMNEVARLFGLMNNVSFATLILLAVKEGRAKFEAQVLERISKCSEDGLKAWQTAIKAIFSPNGEKLALESNDPQIDGYAEQIYGYKVLRGLSDRLVAFLSKMGVPRTSTVIPEPEYEELSLDALDIASRQDYARAVSIFRMLFPTAAKYPIRIMYSAHGNQEKIAGFAGRKDKRYEEICIVTKFRTRLDQPTEELFLTCVHEWWHCKSKSHDFTYAFISEAEQTVLDLAKKLFATLAGEALDPTRSLMPVLPVLVQESS